MSHTIRFILALHNHQPVGNFDGVFEQSYQESYLPFLDVFEGYRDLKIALHTSGSLMEWLDEHHSDYVDRLAHLVEAGRIEIIGGAFYEPILTMIPARDRVGQIRRYTRWLGDRLGAQVRGMWMPERVWEQSLTSDLAAAGIGYTFLDDFHFNSGGVGDQGLHGYYVTEDDGNLLSVFPGSEAMRYLIPFAEPHKTIELLSRLARQFPGAVITCADDGEKFGTWPETYKHVYTEGWLRQFFDLLVENRHWLHLTTPSEALDNVPPLGKVYLPEGSYREMTEWVMPTERLVQYEQVRHDLQADERWERIAPFIRGGYWRNFKTKYPESDEMYARMLLVSRRLAAVEASGLDEPRLDEARAELYRGQCNCSYWHGAFGGLYLPHLRNAVYRHLIAADTLLDQLEGRRGPWVEAKAADLNFDARQEVQLANDKLVAMIAPAAGGMLYECDVRAIGLNLLATMARRPEAYHDKVRGGAGHQGNGAASIHERVVFKQDGLEQRLQYDDYLRKSLLDHFYDLETDLDTVAGGRAGERGDFLASPYEARVRRNPDRIQVQLSRQANAFDVPLRITKGITLEAGRAELEIAYLIEDLPPDCPLHFAVELNFAGLPAGADDRFFYNGQGHKLGQLGTHLDLRGADSLGLVDQWLGIDLKMHFDRPTDVWTFPVATVSQSEGGFELVHQSVVVQPHWIIQADAQGKWSATMTLAIDTSLAESRQKERALAVS